MALSHAPSLVTDGLIIYLDANNSSSYAGTGSTWYDLSGNGRHASLISSPTYEGFGLGKYLSFDGSSNYATIPYTITDNSFTVSLWYYSKVFSSNSLSDAIISNYQVSIAGFDLRLDTPTTLQLDIRVGSSYPNLSFGTIANNTWYHLSFNYDGATVKAFVNGNLVSSSNAVGTRTNGSQICIGTSFVDTGRKATCGIPQVMIFNRALSDSEILQNYNATKKRYLPEENIVRDGLVFHVDASKSNSYAGVGNTIYDISGSGKIGTLTNGPTFSGLNGGSIAFDGSNDYILFPNSDVMGSVYTQNIWFKKNSSNVGDLADAQYSGALVYSGSIVFYYTNVPPYTLTAYYSFAIGVWYCLSLVRGSSVKQIYLNGNILASTGSTDMYDAPGTNFVIGSNGGNSEFLNGNISQVQIYNRALSAQEISQNFNATKGRYGL